MMGFFWAHSVFSNAHFATYCHYFTTAEQLHLRDSRRRNNLHTCVRPHTHTHTNALGHAHTDTHAHTHTQKQTYFYRLRNYRLNCSRLHSFTIRCFQVKNMQSSPLGHFSTMTHQRSYMECICPLTVLPVQTTLHPICMLNVQDPGRGMFRIISLRLILDAAALLCYSRTPGRSWLGAWAGDQELKGAEKSLSPCYEQR